MLRNITISISSHSSMSFVLKRPLNIISRKALKCMIGKSRRNYSVSEPSPSPSEGKWSSWKPIMKASGLGILVGGVYAWYTMVYDSPNQVPVLSASDIIIHNTSKSIKTLPQITFARQIQIPTDKSGLELILFQYPTCPFCCKVRAFLDYYGLSYNVVEVDPVLRQQIKWSEYKKVPILLARSGDSYLQLNDSTMIISCLATYLRSKNKLSLNEAQESYPSFSDLDSKNKTIINRYFVMNGSLDEKQAELEKEERKWRIWADDVLVHTLSPNVYRTKEEAFQAFNWFSEVGEWDRLFPSWERTIIINVGAYAMYYVGKRLKKRHNLKENVRESLYDECRVWLKEVEKRGKFFGGATPNLADLAVYGILSSIEGCLAFQELLENTKIGTWYSNMKMATQSHSGVSISR